MKRKINKTNISAKEFDALFENGDITPYLDTKNAQFINQKIQRINLDIPGDILRIIDKEATRIGVARTALIKVWLAERIETITDK